MKEITIRTYRGKVERLKEERKEEGKEILISIEIDIKDVSSLEELKELEITLKKPEEREEDWRDFLEQLYREESKRYKLKKRNEEKEEIEIRISPRKNMLSTFLVLDLELKN